MLFLFFLVVNSPLNGFYMASITLDPPQERNLLAMKKTVNSLLLIHNTDPKGLKFLFLFLSM